MVLLKTILFLITLIIIKLVISGGLFVRSLFTKTSKKKIDDSMIKCAACDTYTHQSLVIKKSGRSYCSEKCSNT